MSRVSFRVEDQEELVEVDATRDMEELANESQSVQGGATSQSGGIAAAGFKKFIKKSISIRIKQNDQVSTTDFEQQQQQKQPLPLQQQQQQQLDDQSSRQQQMMAMMANRSQLQQQQQYQQQQPPYGVNSRFNDMKNSQDVNAELKSLAELDNSRGLGVGGVGMNMGLGMGMGGGAGMNRMPPLGVGGPGAGGILPLPAHLQQQQQQMHHPQHLPHGQQMPPPHMQQFNDFQRFVLIRFYFTREIRPHNTRIASPSNISPKCPLL